MLTQPQLHPEPQPTVATPTTEPSARWSLGVRIGFRFAFVYLILLCLPFPFGILPHSETVARWYEQIWHGITAWVGQHVLHLASPISFTVALRDTRYGYVELLCQLGFAVIAAALWSVLDRKRLNYSKLQPWLRLYVRVTLGSILLGYGASKVIPSQFPAPWLWRYMDAYGNSNPMGLLWTFMGASQAYTIFAGAVEMLAGVLLFVPRLTTLGALISVGAMANVLMLNLCYDVPVKLYSFQLLAMSGFLLLPELRRLANVFVFNRAAGPVIYPPFFARKWPDRGMLIAQLALGLMFVITQLYGSHERLQSFTVENRLKAPLYGFWSVDDFVLDGTQHPPLITDAVRWQRAVFEQTNLLAIQGMDGKVQRLGGRIDAAKKTIHLTQRGDANWGNLTFENPTPELMTIEGKLGGQQVQIKLHHTDPQFLLTSWKIHWVQD